MPDFLFMDVKQKIKEAALSIGFSDCGFTKAERLNDDANHLENWLAKGYHAQMGYMANHFEKRVNPSMLVERAESVIVLLLNYKPKHVQSEAASPKIARYAYGKDYHFVMKDMLSQLFDFLKNSIDSNIEGRFFVDTAPVLERALAVNAGLGWIGKNSNLIHKRHGSYVFIGEIISNLIIEPDVSIKDACGGCSRCIDACPTKAIVAPAIIDSNKCISYLTIENKDEIPPEFKGLLENRFYGCDICQEVCPWTWKSRAHQIEEFDPHPKLLSNTVSDWNALTEEEYQDIFKKSAVKRAKYSGLMRNLKFLQEE